MELCGIATTTATNTALAWSSSIAPSLHTSQPLSSKWGSKRFRIYCVSKDVGSAQPQKETQMTVSVTGATGFVGRRLVKVCSCNLILSDMILFNMSTSQLSSAFGSDNHSVKVLTRSKYQAQLIFPDKEFPGIIIAEEREWKDCVQSSSAVVNLAGMPISTRWSPEIKKEIKQSRIKVTSKVVEFINESQEETGPKVLVSATAVGYYGTSETKVFDEQSPSGTDYLAEVCREWESAALGVDNNVRLLRIRIGVVLGKDGGALAKMIPIFMLFAGGPLGSGKQWFSWIHVDDLVSLIYEALSNPTYEGVINATAPNPVRLGEMCNHLGSVLGRPSWLPVPDLALKAVLGEGATVVLEGQKVLPARAKELGFSFKYPYVREALKAILS